MKLKSTLAVLLLVSAAPVFSAAPKNRAFERDLAVWKKAHRKFVALKTVDPKTPLIFLEDPDHVLADTDTVKDFLDNCAEIGLDLKDGAVSVRVLASGLNVVTTPLKNFKAYARFLPASPKPELAALYLEESVFDACAAFASRGDTIEARLLFIPNALPAKKWGTAPGQIRSEADYKRECTMNYPTIEEIRRVDELAREYPESLGSWPKAIEIRSQACRNYDYSSR